jgi:hypothetical protein
VYILFVDYDELHDSNVSRGVNPRAPGTRRSRRERRDDLRVFSLLQTHLSIASARRAERAALRNGVHHANGVVWEAVSVDRQSSIPPPPPSDASSSPNADGFRGAADAGLRRRGWCVVNAWPSIAACFAFVAACAERKEGREEGREGGREARQREREIDVLGFVRSFVRSFEGGRRKIWAGRRPLAPAARGC